LTKHQWDCDWCWGGNSNNHFHIESLVNYPALKGRGFTARLIKGETDVNQIFDNTWLTQETWWVLRDLFIQAYGLKKAAEIYRHGDHQTTVSGLTDVLQLQEKADIINADLVYCWIKHGILSNRKNVNCF
jgi:hypothetical protein